MEKIFWTTGLKEQVSGDILISDKMDFKQDS